MNRKIILIAEDSPSIRKYITYTLKVKGFSIIAVSDGMEALEKLPGEKVNLIITDLNMPNVDGFELIRTIRQNPEYKDIPIIILSSLANNDDIEKGLSCGADSYLLKPFCSNRILYEISKYIEVKQ
jgi:two-component system, chemotaxis family, chemotaxis protein CheY